MKKALPLLHLLLLPFLLPAQGSWTQLLNLPGPLRERAVGFSVDGVGYVTTGNSAGMAGLADLWAFDPNTGTWTARTPMEEPRTRAVGMAVGDKGYVGTGLTPLLEGSPDWWQYDPILDVWQALANLPGAGRVDAVGFALDEKCYVGGGLSAAGIALTDFYVFDPAMNNWMQLSDIPEQGISAAATFVAGEKAYAVGGRTLDPEVFSGETWEYDPALDQWNLMASYPGEARLYPAAFSLGNLGFVGSGSTGTLTTDWYAFDPVENGWQQVTDLPGEARSAAVAFAIGEHGYVATGAVSGNGQINDLWQFTPATTSIGNPSADLQVFIHPNPATDLLRVHLPDMPVGGLLHLSLIDPLGREIGNWSTGAQQELVIDVSAFSSGTYVLRLRNERGERSMRLMVQRP
jgi:hypothetical protein